MRTLPGLLLALLAAVAFAQGAYRWIGKDGRVHYSDEPPPPEAQNIEQKRLDASVVGSEKYGYETRRAASNFPVTLYVTAECGNACEIARAYLAKRGVPYTEKRIATPEEVAAFKQATQSETAPTLLVGTMVSKGFQEAAWSDLLDTAGYPPAK